MKLRIGVWRVTWRYLIVLVVVLAIAFGSCFGVFFSVDDSGSIIFNPFGTSQIMFIAISLSLALIIYFVAIFGFSYIIEDKYFVVKRLKKEIAYDYKNIEFIDIETSKRKKQVIFYCKTLKMRYLLGDKNGVLLDTLIKKCPNIMTVEEFRRAHPEERY